MLPSQSNGPGSAARFMFPRYSRGQPEPDYELHRVLPTPQCPVNCCQVSTTVMSYRSLITWSFMSNRYLRGVPFGWPLRLWRPWAVALSVLAAVFFVLDSLNMRREDAAGYG